MIAFRPLKIFYLTLIMLALPYHSHAAPYIINYEKSQILFSGTHAGTEFQGRAEDWQGEIIFDPEALNSSTISATIESNSIKTGNALYDGTLPEADWLNSDEFPTITFTSTALKALDNNNYEMQGLLTIREITKDITIPFQLNDDENGNKTAYAKFEIDRVAFNIGQQSDPDALWVSPNLQMDLSITAAKPNEE